MACRRCPTDELIDLALRSAHERLRERCDRSNILEVLEGKHAAYDSEDLQGGPSSSDVALERFEHLRKRKIGDKRAQTHKCQRYWLVMRDHYYPTISNTPNYHYYAPYCYSNALL